MTKVEEVARALCSDFGMDPDLVTSPGSDMQHLDGVWCLVPKPGVPSWQRFIKQAKVAISAMRGPTEEMMRSGQGWREWDQDAPALARAYGAMIDAALTEDQPKAQAA